MCDLYMEQIMFAIAMPFLVNFRKYLPWLAVILLFVLAHAVGGKIVTGWQKSIEEKAYLKGVDAERSRQDQLARKIEKALAPRLDEIDEKAGREITAQREKETKYVKEITREIQGDPVYVDCRVSDGVLASRNALRRSIDATIGAPAGTGLEPAPPATP